MLSTKTIQKIESSMLATQIIHQYAKENWVCPLIRRSGFVLNIVSHALFTKIIKKIESPMLATKTIKKTRELYVGYKNYTSSC
jgi:hypothetical protein